MINYAHRGGSEYAPENTLSSFYLGLLQGANGIETDVQRTRDGVLVLFHDDTLDRVTDHTGRIGDYTLAELRTFRVHGNSTRGFYDRIVTFEEFLDKFCDYDIHFAIELKEDNTEREVVDMLAAHHMLDKTTVTSFGFSRLAAVKAYNPAVRVGLLTVGDGCSRIGELRSIGGEEMAPEGQTMTAKSVKALRDAGFGVRAWGVFSIDSMRRLCALGVDGMTVNFPDRLTEYLASERR